METLRQREAAVEQAFLDWLTGLSEKLAEIREPPFSCEIEVVEVEGQPAVKAADRVLAIGKDLLSRLRGGR